MLPYYRENDFCRQALKTKSKYEYVKLLLAAYSFNARLFPYLYKIFMPDYSYEKGGYALLFSKRDDLEIKSREWVSTYDETIKVVLESTIERCIRNGVQIVFVFTPR